MTTMPSVRVYADGRQFVVVSLMAGAEGQPVEVAPVYPIHLTMGRSVAYSLAQALRDTESRSRTAAYTDRVAWDGGGGRWWSHHLLRVTITWCADHISVVPDDERARLGRRAARQIRQRNAEAPEGDDDSHAVTFPMDASASQLAEWLIRALGERLS
jgi:hypothetical protein